MRQLYIDPKVFKSLHSLKRYRKKVANRAEEVIAKLRSAKIRPQHAGNVSKHGEQRIKGVMKYDLGSGYRMIAFKQGEMFFLLFAGSHDECHRWLENNRELTVEQIKHRCRRISTVNQPFQEALTAVEDRSEGSSTEEEYNPLAAATEKDLRQLFCGIAGTSSLG